MSIAFDIYQQGQIAQASQKAEHASNKVGRAFQDIEELMRRLDRLTLASQAMWELLRETGHFSDKVLTAKMEEIDLRDGLADGKISRVVRKCPKCGRNSNSRRLECIYCSTPLLDPNLFDAR